MFPDSGKYKLALFTEKVGGDHHGHDDGEHLAGLLDDADADEITAQAGEGYLIGGEAETYSNPHAR